MFYDTAVNTELVKLSTKGQSGSLPAWQASLQLPPYRNYRLDSLHWHGSLWPNFDVSISKLRWTLKLRIGYELRELMSIVKCQVWPTL